MITKKDRNYGRPWLVKISGNYIGSFATQEQAAAAEEEARTHKDEFGFYPKISSEEYIPKQYSEQISKGVVTAESVMRGRTHTQQMNINKANARHEEETGEDRDGNAHQARILSLECAIAYLMKKLANIEAEHQRLFLQKEACEEELEDLHIKS